MLIVIAVVIAMVLVASSGDTKNKNACGEVGCSKSESPTFSVKATRGSLSRSTS